MAVVCSRCSHVYEPTATCPRCGAASTVRDPHHDTPAPGHGPRWQQTAWGRVLIGLIVAQGLFYGLRQLLTAVLMGITGVEAPAELWKEMRHVLALQGVQVLSLLLGGMMAGGGQRQGFVLGAVVGAWNGILAALLKQGADQNYLSAVGAYGLPLLHAAFAAIGGLVGSVVWRPIPAAAVPVALAGPRKPATVKPSRPLFAGRIAWLRCAVGAALAVAGTLSAHRIFTRVMNLSAGQLSTSGVLEDQLITWEIKALSVLLGAALAGATTSNGLKQGLVVGLAASVILIGLQVERAKEPFEFMVLTFVSTLSLALAGGWFGGQLLPPLARRPAGMSGPRWG